ncbi:uncharacterized protein N7484_010177 [Penicillium longicatenatum]|uniref:uncharacterized protein n=1 Tax=Penicillium longicatenatum TaxID=1561947 RepID=UPI002548B1B4|nr:uncharacterized protein N7484_010177 [Penicillium longicatenatum]KAJ5636864.1 hypothetical protein N7484_010177 [Penicillium longicatenatum]
MGENVFPTEAPRSASLEPGASPRPEPRDETVEPASGLAIDPQNPSFTSYRETTRHESEASTSTRPYIRPALAQPAPNDPPIFHLATYEGMCKRRGILDGTSICDGLADYCEFTVRMWIESSLNWKFRDFKALKEEMRVRYQDQDGEYYRYSRTSLSELVAQNHESYDEIR